MKKNKSIWSEKAKLLTKELHNEISIDNYSWHKLRGNKKRRSGELIISAISQLINEGDEKEIESLLIIKTTSQNINSVKDLIEEHHNYDIPEIIDINASILNDSYQEWFNQVLK